ncbi:MAG: four helix bundle protein [Acidobacteria bacterium]|nr:MAG: four helix bundle protein [Acidobacteriota bacterium]
MDATLTTTTGVQDYHELEIWQRAMTYAVEVYRFSSQLPDDERYNLTAQLRRAVTSVPLNIAEGAACITNVEFAQFLGYAYRSLKEVATSLELCQRLYPAAQSNVVLLDEGQQISKMVHTLIRRLKTSTSATP